MKFQCPKYTNAVYVIDRDRQITTQTGQQLPDPTNRHLRAEFRPPAGIFDSVVAQKRYNWTDEERLRVERYLLTHWDFGRPSVNAEGGLFLAPGETIPPEHADVKLTSLEVDEIPNDVEPESFQCSYVAATEDGGVEQCPNKARKGKDLCARHQKDVDALASAI